MVGTAYKGVANHLVGTAYNGGNKPPGGNRPGSEPLR